MLHELSTLPGQTLHDVERDGIHVVHGTLLDAVTWRILVEDSHDVRPEVHLLLLHLLARHSASAARGPHDLWRSTASGGIGNSLERFHGIF